MTVFEPGCGTESLQTSDLFYGDWGAIRPPYVSCDPLEKGAGTTETRNAQPFYSKSRSLTSTLTGEVGRMSKEETAEFGVVSSEVKRSLFTL